MSINESLIKLIKKYQNNKPPGTPARCVHYPTCSNYSIECYEKFNLFKATFLTIKRIIFCTPLNRKFYDPVPYTKEEKKINKELYKLAEGIEDILLEHYQKYPQMELNDFIKLIYQNSFGPRHMHNPSKEDVLKYLDEEIKVVTNETEIIEEIGNGYVRVYLSKETNIEKLSNDFFNSMIEDTYTETNIRVFYRKLNVLIKLIKKGSIKLPKKESINLVNEYLSNGINPVRHTKIYNKLYKPHYRVIRK
jgi:putative membrane protein insertion efficiency factor